MDKDKRLESKNVFELLRALNDNSHKDYKPLINHEAKTNTIPKPYIKVHNTIKKKQCLPCEKWSVVMMEVFVGLEALCRHQLQALPGWGLVHSSPLT